MLKGRQNSATRLGSAGDYWIGGPGVSLRSTPGYFPASLQLAQAVVRSGTLAAVDAPGPRYSHFPGTRGARLSSNVKAFTMFNWFKKQPPLTEGPDFSDINSKDKAEARSQSGELEKLLLLPAEFGGTDDPRNIVYVPRSFVAIKANIDRNIIKPLVAERKVTRYEATPEYQGKSLVPIAIKIVASEPGSFTTSINIWGKALARKADL